MEGEYSCDFNVTLYTNTTSSLHFLLILCEIRVSAAPGLSLRNRNPMWAGPRQHRKSGNSNVFICRKKSVSLCVCAGVCVCLFGFVCHMQCAREGSLEHIGVRALWLIIVANA